MGIETPLDIGHKLQTAVREFMDAYSNGYEMAYGITERGDGGGSSSGTSDRTGQSAVSNGYAKAQLKKAGKKARAALTTLAIGESALGELFHEISGKTSDDDPPPLSITRDRFKKDPQLEAAYAARDKRQAGETTVIAADRFGVV